MQPLLLPPSAKQALAQAALTYRYGEEHQRITEEQVLQPRRFEDLDGLPTFTRELD